MRIWALSDTHLGPGVGKGHPSSGWRDHQRMLRRTMDERIKSEDLVLMPGDFSWNRDPVDLRYDYLWLDERPGTKIMSPGNHDYGIWDSGEEARGFCEQFETLRPLRDEAMRMDNPHDPALPGLVVVGVEGSQAPGNRYFNTNAGHSASGKDPESVRFLVQLLALSRSLAHAAELRRPDDALVVLFHYPPFTEGSDGVSYETVWSTMIERAGTTLCLYGHLHQESQFRAAYQGNNRGVEYRFVGADFLEFHPTRIGTWTRRGLVVDPPEVVAEIAYPERRRAAEKIAEPTTVAVSGSSGVVYGGTTSTATSTLVDECQLCHTDIRAGEEYHEHGGYVWHTGCEEGSDGAQG